MRVAAGYGNIHAITLSLARKVYSLQEHARQGFSPEAIAEAVKLVRQNERALDSKLVVTNGTNCNFITYSGLESTVEGLSNLLRDRYGIKCKTFHQATNNGEVMESEGKTALLDPKTGAIANSLFNFNNNVWFVSAHGIEGGSHFFFNSYDESVELNPTARYNNAANVDEIFYAFLARAKKLPGDLNGRLDDTIIMLDICYSWDFAAKLLQRFLEAYLLGEIKTLPFIVTASNRGTISMGLTLREGEERGYFPEALVKILKTGKPFNFSVFREMQVYTGLMQDTVVFAPPANETIRQFMIQFGGYRPIKFNNNPVDRMMFILAQATPNNPLYPVLSAATGRKLGGVDMREDGFKIKTTGTTAASNTGNNVNSIPEYAGLAVERITTQSLPFKTVDTMFETHPAIRQ
jgi:hypothetical protein